MVVAQKYGAQGFTVSQVIAIKRALISGAPITALARWYKVSAETIRRIKRGETYNHIDVAGEDSLRPTIILTEFDPGDGSPVPMVLPAGRVTMSDEEAELRTREMEESLGIKVKPTDEPKPTEGSPVRRAEIAPEVQSEADKFLKG